MTRRIYLDYNATTPCAEEVAAAMAGCSRDAYGNPSSTHWAGSAARDAVEAARSQAASLVCCDATEIVFTSGGTEANNLVFKGLFFSRGGGRRPFHVITSEIEHPSVLAPCGFLERLGAEVTRVRVDRFGSVDPDDVRRAVRADTALVSIMHANNEVGTIQPLAEISAITRDRGILFHSDAAQSVGKITVDVESLGVDLSSIAGHKFYGPKGVGALYVREGIELEPLLHGADHEAGRRAGTENVPAIVGLGVACDVAAGRIDDGSIVALRDALWDGLRREFGDQVALNGHPTARLPNTLNVGFRGRIGREVLDAVPDVAASTGSACHAGGIQLSPVLTAMRVDGDAALGAVRFSLGRGTSREEIAAVVELLSACLPKLGSTT
jgi:cysteine desulfurase